MGGNGAGALTIGQKTLNKRLKDAGMLATTDKKRGTSTIRKVLQDQQRDVLHLRKAAFWGQTTEEQCQKCQFCRLWGGELSTRSGSLTQSKN
jgi:hypothetical protein